jgi:hypothetical protein
VSRAGGAPYRLPLAISPDPVAIGLVCAGVPSHSSLLVRNTIAIPVTLDRVASSCPCVEVTGAPLELGSNETKSLTVTVDTSDDPSFGGGLSVQINGYLRDGTIGFQTKVNFEADL